MEFLTLYNNTKSEIICFKFYLVVRESACQTFGSIITIPENFDDEKLEIIGKIMISFLEKTDWQVNKILSTHFIALLS